MTLFNKLKWILGILLIFVLIVSTNLIDRNHFLRVRDLLVTIYEDRLQTYDIIYELSESFHEKEIAVILSDTTFFKQRSKVIENDIQDLLTRFGQTKLTYKENKVFIVLKRNVERLDQLQTEFVNSGYQDKTALRDIIFQIKMNLNELSKIQLEEGGRLISISQKAIDTVELFTHIEIYLLLFLAIIIQILIIYQPKKKKIESE